MSSLEYDLRDLVIANRILSDHGVVDAFGHVTIRHPDRTDRFFMSKSKSPGSVSIDDLIEFDLDCNPIDQNGRRMYAERAIHGSIYRARPDVMSVCHNHSPAVIPFGITDVPLRPVFHVGAVIGTQPPVWDIAQGFGDTNLLVTTREQGDSLAQALGDLNVILMRGHGAAVASASLRRTVFISVYMQKNAELQTIAHGLGNVHYLTAGEVKASNELHFSSLPMDRAWNEWCERAGFGGI
jgi:ribulose-5-phosphate 4-epimerase/fuculose-1-phosphate aldolase